MEYARFLLRRILAGSVHKKLEKICVLGLTFGWRNEWTFKFDEIMAGTDDAVESVSIGWPCWYAKTKNEFF